MTSQTAEKPFTFVDPFAPPVAVLDDVEKATLLSALHFNTDNTPGVWVSKPGEFYRQMVEDAGLSWTDFIQSSTYPQMVAHLPDAMLQATARNCVYSFSGLASYCQSYYLELIPECNRVYIKYNRIIGSRLLCRLSDEEFSALRTRLVEELKAFGTTDAYRKLQERAQTVRADIARREAGTARETAVKAAGATKVLQQLATLRPQDNLLVLPKQNLSEYAAIKRMLETAGARYSTQITGFVFDPDTDAEAVLEQLLAGETVNPKKDFQFFASTAAVVDAIRDMLPDSLEGKSMLEPSAGDGVLADLGKQLGATVATVELWDKNVAKLKAKGYVPVEADFLTLSPADLGQFDLVIANPPFTKGQDIKHLHHMAQFLKPSGSVYCVMSTAWQRASSRSAAEFRSFLALAKAQTVDLPPGTFQESGTSVGAVLVVMTAENIANAQPLPMAA